MPRTRQMRKVEKPEEPNITLKDVEAKAQEEYIKTYEIIISNILEEKTAMISALKMKIRQDRLSIPVAIGNSKIKDLRQGNTSVWQKLNTLSSFSVMNSIFQSKNDISRKKISAKDDGYVTSESSTGSSGGSTRSRALKRSSSFSIRPRSSSSINDSCVKSSVKPLKSQSAVRKSKRLSRSLSRTQQVTKKWEDTPTKTANSNYYKTPKNTNTLNSLGMITPKIKPNTPQVVLRRPQQGEIAISLQGSPLLATTMATETTANINIPLPDGRLINIQPMKGLRTSDIPTLDPEIQRQLQTLMDNLEKVCKMANQ